MNSGLTIKLISFLLLQDDGLLINNKPAAATFPVGYPCLPPPCWTTMPKCGFDDDDGWANFPPSALPPETKALFGGLQKSQQDEAAQAMTAIAVATATGNVVNTFDENNNENKKEEKEEPQGNETNSSSAAPVGNGTNKKKKRTTYTASQKLAILNEIDQKTPLESQESILRKHGISKFSVINWRKKREVIEMKSNFEKSDLSTGIEQYTWNEKIKKINWTIKDTNATNTYELKSAIAEDPSEKSNRKRKRREAYSIAEKLAILDEIDQKVLSQEFICKKYGTTRNSVSIWRNNREEYERQVAEDKRGKKRTVLHNDGLRRIKNGLKAFHEFNMTLPSESRLPLSGENHALVILIPFHYKTHTLTLPHDPRCNHFETSTGN